MRAVLDARVLVAMAIAGAVGAWGVIRFPLAVDNVSLALIQLREPFVFQVLAYGYATLWFTTPFIATSLLTSVCAIVVYRYPASVHHRALPPYPSPESRTAPLPVLGETHFTSAPGRVPSPGWLTIPQRGPYTGVMILGAVGTGKTSACMYPYVEQLLRWRAQDPDRKVGGLVLEVKGDFCRQLRGMLKAANRSIDYLEMTSLPLRSLDRRA